MIKRLVSVALEFPLAIAALAAGIAVAGVYAYGQLDIEAYPDPVPPMLDVITQPPGWAAEEVERYVTVPLELAMSGIPGLDHIRSSSVFGLSDVKVYFKWDTEYDKDRQEVLNRLGLTQLPNNLQAGLSPENPIGEIYRYLVTAPPGYDLADLKTYEDWTLEKQLKTVPGVIDVAGFGGLTRQYHVDLDPYRLRGQGVTLGQVLTAVGNANQNVGGNVLRQGEQSFNVRGLGLLGGVGDLRNVVVSATHGTPVRVGDIGSVSLGHASRLGVVGHDENGDVVQGIVLMRKGGDTLKTLAGVRAKVDEIRKLNVLPPGVDVQPYYDRTALVETTTHTVLHNLFVGMALVLVVLLVFLSNVRAALITAVNIPLALLAAFLLMVLTGTPANLISLGAVDFGIIIDSTVIMMENVFHHLADKDAASAKQHVLHAAGEVGGPMAFSTTIIAVAFLPLFTFTGVVGVIFSPMAHTYAFAIGAAVLFALTLTPTLARLLGKVKDEGNFVTRAIEKAYDPLFERAVKHPWKAVAILGVPVLLGIACFPLLGREFMPKLEEGNLWVRATLPTSIALEDSARYVERMRAVFRKHDEVETVVSQLGRPDDGTDTAGFYNVEFFVPLKTIDEWKGAHSKQELTGQLQTELSRAMPGVDFNFSQNIQDNVEEALSGVKGENSVKVVGPDLRVNEAKAREIVAALKTVRGVEDLAMMPVLGQPDVKIVPDREACARYGLNVGDVEQVVQAAIGGQAVTQVFEGEKRFDVAVRYLEPFRKDLPRLREIRVATPDGQDVPLGQIAKITEEDGPAFIYREDHHRYVPVKFSVRGRDLAGAIAEAQAKVKASVRLPYETHLEWAGEIDELHDATRRLVFVVPLTLVLIALLVYASTRSVASLGVVLAELPVACAGGIVALVVAGQNFSISAAMGFISLFGIAIQDGLLLVTYAQRLWDEGHGLEEGVLLAARRRLRSALMTTLVALIGLLPAALSHGIGSETQRPLALVVIGGALTVALVPRVLMPPLLVLAHRGRGKFRVPSGAPTPEMTVA